MCVCVCACMFMCVGEGMMWILLIFNHAVMDDCQLGRTIHRNTLLWYTVCVGWVYSVCVHACMFMCVEEGVYRQGCGIVEIMRYK